MSAATFRTPSNLVFNQNLFVLINTGTARVVRVRRLVAQVDTAVVFTSLPILLRLSRITSYTGGQALTKVNWTATTSDASIEARGRNTSDGGGQTDIVATPGEILWQQYATRMSSTAGQKIGDDQDLAPLEIVNDPIVLREDEGLLVFLEVPTATSNFTNNFQYFVQAAWSEDVS
jgi:hypothetical protein